MVQRYVEKDALLYKFPANGHMSSNHDDRQTTQIADWSGIHGDLMPAKLESAVPLFPIHPEVGESAVQVAHQISRHSHSYTYKTEDGSEHQVRAVLPA